MTNRYLGRYRLLREIGRGGMATVYHAVQEGPHGFRQEVAIKLVHPDLLREHPHVLQMLVDEARIAARIKHPNVVRILDLCQDPAGFYMVMDYVDGLSMRQVLDAAREVGRPSPLAPVLDALAQACDGLEAAHNLAHADGTLLELVHRDVKPGNILMASGGDVKVADFGIAWFADRLSDDTSHGQMKGTPAYISPEQAMGSKVDRRADLFSMGLTLYTMATNDLAFTGETGTAVALRITQESIEPQAARLSEIALGLGDVLRKACAKDPEERYRTATEMGQAIREVRGRLVDGTSVAELLAGSGWRPWDQQEHLPGNLFLAASVDQSSGSLLELSDESATVADTVAPDDDLIEDTVAPDDDLNEDTVAPDDDLIEDTVVPDDDLSEGSPVEPGVGGKLTPRVDLEITPILPRVEVILPGEGPSLAPRPNPVPPGAPFPPRPPGYSTPLSEPPSQVGLRRPSGQPGGSLGGPSPFSGGFESTNHGRRVLPERDYRGRVVRKEIDEKATRVGGGEKLMVAFTALFVIAAVGSVIMLGLDEEASASKVMTPVDLEGQIVSETAGLGQEPSLVLGASEFPTPERGSTSNPETEPGDVVVAGSPAPVDAESATPVDTAPSGRELPDRSKPPVVAPRGKTPTEQPTAATSKVSGPGSLTLNTYPWSKVYIDGTDLGRTPLVGHSLEAGEHTLRFVIPGLGDREITETVTIVGGEETKIVRRIREDEAASVPSGEKSGDSLGTDETESEEPGGE